MANASSRKNSRSKRRARIRTKISGTAERPRVCVMVSNRRIYLQFVDDTRAVTLAAVSTLSGDAQGGKTVECARALGLRAAELAKQKGMERLVFDRGGHKFHGRVKAIADTMREAGLQF